MDSMELRQNTFDYKAIDAPISSFLREKEANIRDITGQTYTNIGKELKEAKDKLGGSNQYNGYFEKWLRFIGITKDTAYRLINRYELVVANCNEQSLIEELPLSLSYEISKPSADVKLKKQVLNGEITSLKEFKELEGKNKELEKTIEELKSKPPEAVIVPPSDYKETKAELEKLKNNLELAELEKQQLQRRLKEETNPEQFQQMAKRESEARVEVHQLKKQLEAMEADSKTVEHKVKIASVNFCARVHNFLESVGGMVWINDYADSFTEKEKQEYFKALDAVEAWAQHVRNNFKENE